MKITSNTIGNYGPGYTNQVKQNNQVLRKAENTQVKQLQTQEVQHTTAAKSEGISTDEKNFFIGLYPENKNEIVDYHFYQKTGKMSGVSVGSLFDRRG